MNSKKKNINLYLLISAAVILISVTLRSAALFADFVPTSGYFDKKGLITSAGIITAIGAILLFTYAFTSSKSECLIASFSTPETYIPTGAVCTAISFFVIYGIIKIKNIGLPFSQLFSINDLGRSVFVISVLLAIGSLIYFILTALLTERNSQTRATFGLFNVLFLALYASYLYFDTSLSMNAPNKIVDQMAFLFAALFFLYEVRISLGREVWNFYISFGFIAALLTAYSSIPSIIYYFTTGTTVSNNIYENIITLTLFIFILSRLILSSKLKEDKESEILEYVKNYSEERSNYIKSITDEAFSTYLESCKSNEETENKKEDTSQDQSASFSEELDDEDLIEITSSEEKEVLQEGSNNTSSKTINESTNDSENEQNDNITEVV